jgi:hypothetical protein
MHRGTSKLLILGWVFAVCASPCAAEEFLSLPDGVTHVALPPGTLKVAYKVKDGKPLLRVSVGETAVEARTIFLGDGKAATRFEATKEGVRWVSTKGETSLTISEMVSEPGSTIGVQGGGFLELHELKPGSVYVTTPSIKFTFSTKNPPQLFLQAPP